MTIQMMIVMMILYEYRHFYNISKVEWDLEYYKKNILQNTTPEFWSWISGNQHILPEDFIVEYWENIDWDELIKKQQLDEKMMSKILLQKKTTMQKLCKHQCLSETFVRSHYYLLNQKNLNQISCKSKLSEKFLHENRDRLDWLY